jgi:hypothetical protein
MSIRELARRYDHSHYIICVILTKLESKRFERVKLRPSILDVRIMSNGKPQDSQKDRFWRQTIGRWQIAGG